MCDQDYTPVTPPTRSGVKRDARARSERCAYSYMDMRNAFANRRIREGLHQG